MNIASNIDKNDARLAPIAESLKIIVSAMDLGEEYELYNSLVFDLEEIVRNRQLMEIQESKTSFCGNCNGSVRWK